MKKELLTPLFVSYQQFIRFKEYPNTKFKCAGFHKEYIIRHGLKSKYWVMYKSYYKSNPEELMIIVRIHKANSFKIWVNNKVKKLLNCIIKLKRKYAGG